MWFGDVVPTFKCRDIGMDCDFEMSAANDEELMQKVAAHASSVHNLEMSPELSQKIRSAIKEETEAQTSPL